MKRRLFAPLLVPVLTFLFVPAALAASTTGTVMSQDVAGILPASNLKIDVNFQRIDSDGLAILKFGTVLIKTQLSGVRVKDKARDNLDAVLPEGARLQAEIVQKGSIPTVILWKGTVNVNAQLLAQGLADIVQ
ncbi:hypothetical protein MF271_05225 [Deinococcus sp. KNUC1210]|uniref:hypothetical protein n=1 Tax=Deinococcus sp. KNUC1210 TaxID=2917691 RepID=UPI001EF05B81|nr:hypothetical protein [Deinococcus sp. KNUC1210]ULH16036.1 hypothetical protein MF271_05225 [Deinococcus sp. KNUC1210]